MKIKMFDATIQVDPYFACFAWMNFNKFNDNMIKEGLINSLRDLDPRVKYLDLSANQFDKCDSAFLIQMARSIPVTVEFLDLSFNDLAKLDIDVLVAFFRALPTTIQTLNLSHNELGKMPIENIMCINNALSSLKEIDISSNYLEKLGIFTNVARIFTDSGKIIISYREKKEELIKNISKSHPSI
jgi:Leucine Rich repeat